MTSPQSKHVSLLQIIVLLVVVLFIFVMCTGGFGGEQPGYDEWGEEWWELQGYREGEITKSDD